jgi:Raf kinase inhibitor-like YbhB/YbcL family protein
MKKTLRAPAPLRLCAATLLCGALVAVACGTAQANAPAASRVSGNAGRLDPFTVISPDFRDGGFLPPSAELGGPVGQGVCKGKNSAPSLRWFNVPAGTKSFTLTIIDVDAPLATGFHHWVVYNIPAKHPWLFGHGWNPFSEGTNDFGTTSYGGPCPPPTGQPHHYVFTVYALMVSHISGAHLTYSQLMTKIAPDIQGATSIVGLFSLPLHR